MIDRISAFSTHSVHNFTYKILLLYVALIVTDLVELLISYLMYVNVCSTRTYNTVVSCSMNILLPFFTSS
jgi:hypothetical protein